MNRNTPLLEVSNLRVAFDGKEVVRGIDFTIQPGEKLALVGESGSGKTVTALSLLRLVMHARITGSAGFLGRDLLALPESDLRGIRGSDIAMIFQEPMTALNPLFTVGEQIAEVLELKQGHSSVDAARMAIDLLAETGITEAQRRAALTALVCFGAGPAAGPRARAGAAGHPGILAWGPGGCWDRRGGVGDLAWGSPGMVNSIFV